MTGVIYTDSRVRPELFGASAKVLVQSFANQAALAIENARLFEEVRSSLSEITAMRDLMANVFESIASGVITVDTDGHVITLNPAAAQILGITPRDNIGQLIGHLIPTDTNVLDRAMKQINESQMEQHVDLDTCLQPGRHSRVMTDGPDIVGETGRGDRCDPVDIGLARRGITSLHSEHVAERCEKAFKGCG